jgi:choline-sulfatase
VPSYASCHREKPSLLAVFVAVLAAACGRSPVDSHARAKPNVLLVTIDTLRVDRLGTGVAPALDRLAAASLQFTSARTAVPLTLPSHTTILTGQLPPEHGVRDNGVDPSGNPTDTAARLLNAAGYQTAAFVGAYVLDRRFGLSQGFDTYDDQIPRDPNATERLEAERPASAVVDRALAWLDRFAPVTLAPGTNAPGTVAPSNRAPFFVWIHLYDPHAPYNPPREFVRATADRTATVEERYDGEVRYADAQIARVLAWLDAHALRDRTFVVVAGDHGEGLGDHGERTHGMLLYDSTLRVPLIVSMPGTAAARRDDPVSLADIAPTVLHAAGIAVPPAMKGRDLLAQVRLKPDTTYENQARATSDVRSVRLQADLTELYSETEYPRVAGWSPLHALTDGRWMAISGAGATALYDLQNDPHEERDVSDAQRSVTAALASRIDAIRRRAANPAGRAISSDAAQRLRSLGYVASSGQPSPGNGGPHPASKIDAWNQFEEALAALNSGQVAAAASALTKLATTNPDAPVFQTTYARALGESGQSARALEVYRRAAQRWPTDALLLHDLAVAARNAAAKTSGPVANALLDEAVRADRAALVLSPNSAVAHNGLGLLAVDLNRPQDALKEFERAATIDPNNASYSTNVGNARRAVGDASGAEQAYRRALEVDPRAADAINGLGVLLVETKRPTEAIPLFERAIAAAPDFQEARLNLGIALQESGQTARAADTYRQVLAAPAHYKRERDAAAKLLAAIGNAR